MKCSVRAGIGDRDVLARTRTDRIVSSEGKRRTSAGAFASIRKTRVTISPAASLQNPSAKCEAFCIRSIAAALGVFTPFFPSAQRHCTSATNVVNTNAATFWHLGTDHSRPSCTCEYCKTRLQMLGFSIKNDLTTLFANVRCPAISDRIVSVQRRGGSLGSGIRLTIFHSSFPSFSVST